MDKKENQHKRIWNHMLKYGSISMIEGYEKLKITKVNTRVGEMIKLGYPIRKQRESYVGEDGKVVRYMRYYPEVV